MSTKSAPAPGQIGSAEKPHELWIEAATSFGRNQQGAIGVGVNTLLPEHFLFFMKMSTAETLRRNLTAAITDAANYAARHGGAVLDALPPDGIVSVLSVDAGVSQDHTKPVLTLRTSQDHKIQLELDDPNILPALLKLLPKIQSAIDLAAAARRN